MRPLSCCCFGGRGGEEEGKGKGEGVHGGVGREAVVRPVR